jgi:hypothetical protein
MDLSEGPNLIADNVLKNLATSTVETPSLTISDKVIQFGGCLFNSIIKDNLIWILLIAVFIMFLVYRYRIKEQRKSVEKYDSVGANEYVHYNTGYMDDEPSIMPNATNYLPVSNPTFGNMPENRYYFNKYTKPYDEYGSSPMVNPYGFPTNDNETTGNFIDYAAALNNAHDYTVIPPYAT